MFWEKLGDQLSIQMYQSIARNLFFQRYPDPLAFYSYKDFKILVS